MLIFSPDTGTARKGTRPDLGAGKVSSGVQMSKKETWGWGGGGSLGAERGCEEGKTCLLLAFEPFSPAASSLLLRIQALEAGLASKAKTCSFTFTVQTLQKDQQSEAGVFRLGSTAAAQVQGSSTIRAGPGGREVGGRAGCSPSARCGRGGCPRTSLSGLR